MLLPGSKIRFQAVSVDGYQGYVWKLNTKRHTGDVYLENGYAKIPIHISLHDSGEWHYAWEERVNGKTERQYRSISNERPDVIPGWKHGIRIVVGKKDVVMQESRLGVIQVQFHPEYEYICMDVFIGLADAPKIDLPPDQRIAHMRLGDGRQLMIFRRGYVSDSSPQEAFDDQVLDARSKLSEVGWDGSPQSVVVMCNTEQNYGYLQYVEMNIA